MPKSQLLKKIKEIQKRIIRITTAPKKCLIINAFEFVEAEKAGSTSVAGWRKYNNLYKSTNSKVAWTYAERSIQCDNKEVNYSI